MIGKRLIDILGSGIGLIVAVIPMIVLATLVALWLGRPVLFRQERLGKAGRRFQMVKFRTMTDTRDAEGNLLPDEDRLTPFGTILRKYRLDELPELLTILKGDMSLVGPRPLPLYIMEEILAKQGQNAGDKRSEMAPGLTGYAQVCGGTALTNEEKFALDNWYVAQWSLGLDIWIIAKTLSFIISGEKRDEPRIRQAMEAAIGGT